MHLSVISEELKNILYAVIFGCFFGSVYDIIKIIRMFFGISEENRHKRRFLRVLWVQIADIVYMIFFAISFCIFLYYFNCGIFRWYLAAATAAGIFVYRYTLGILVIKASSFIIKGIHLVIYYAVKVPLSFMGKVIARCARPITDGLSRFIGGKRTDRILKRIIKNVEKCYTEKEI